MSKAMTSGTARAMDSDHISMISTVVHLGTPIPLMRLHDATARYLVKVWLVNHDFKTQQKKNYKITHPCPLHHYSCCTIMSRVYLFSVTDWLSMWYTVCFSSTNTFTTLLRLHDSYAACFVAYLFRPNIKWFSVKRQHDMLMTFIYSFSRNSGKDYCVLNRLIFYSLRNILKKFVRKYCNTVLHEWAHACCPAINTNLFILYY